MFWMGIFDRGKVVTPKRKQYEKLVLMWPWQYYRPKFLDDRARNLPARVSTYVQDKIIFIAGWLRMGIPPCTCKSFRSFKTPITVLTTRKENFGRSRSKEDSRYWTITGSWQNKQNFWRLFCGEKGILSFLTLEFSN